MHLAQGFSDAAIKSIKPSASWEAQREFLSRRGVSPALEKAIFSRAECKGLEGRASSFRWKHSKRPVNFSRRAKKLKKRLLSN